ncbi:MAG TPA: hypothetical protein PKD09_23895 [Aggregatilinea sp.]|jgi:hypothetical protein|uniref:PD-(D/E)XK nuclease superfamily protein n=1 Tax=Aggregatilinea sp. TaxID=2806333 RepID=UPI002CCF2D70|nr:PD-(D/E)XK nuclease superfamily protein [Aggregatilinea sp.]HML24718.1 hypothetical protein [Aggregatilinea sp.]
MPGRGRAVQSGQDMEFEVMQLAEALGLEARRQFRVGRRIWGAVRVIDVVVRHPDTRQTLGIECKYQGSTGSAEEKIPSTVLDIEAWPIAGIIVFAGEGFSGNMRSYLYSTGKAVDLEDLDMWLRLFFGLDLEG